MAVARGRGLCRMCGERYAGLESVDIFEARGTKPAYCDLLRDLLGLNPYRGDMKPERLGSTCAKLLDEWERFRNRCTEAQKILQEKCLAQKKQNVCDEPVASSSGTGQSKQSNDGAGPSSAATTTCTLKRPLSSDSDDSDDEDIRPNTRLRRS